MTTLANAIIHGQVSEVIREAKANEHLNFIDEYGYTPLIETCIVDDILSVVIVFIYDAFDGLDLGTDHFINETDL